MLKQGPTQQISEEHYQYFSLKGYSQDEITTYMSLIQALLKKDAVLAKQISSGIKGEQIARAKQFRNEYNSYEETKIKKELEKAKEEFKVIDQEHEAAISKHQEATLKRQEATRKYQEATQKHAEAVKKVEISTSICNELDDIQKKLADIELKEKEIARKEAEMRRLKDSISLNARDLAKEVKEFKGPAPSSAYTHSSSTKKTLRA